VNYVLEFFINRKTKKKIYEESFGITT
jgi:hypothetical protein